MSLFCDCPYCRTTRDRILSCDLCGVPCCRYQSSPSRSLPCPRHDSMVSVTNKQTYEEEGRGDEYLHLVTIYSCNRQNNTPGTFSCRVELGTSSPDEEDEVRCRRRIQEENDNCLVVFRTIPWFKTQMTPLHRVFHKIQKSNYIEECFILSKGFKIFQPQLWHRAFSVVEIVDDFLWGNKNILLHCSLQLNFYVSKSNLLLIFWS